MSVWGSPARLISSRSGVCFYFFLIYLVAWTGIVGRSFCFLFSTSTGLKMGISVILGGSSRGSTEGPEGKGRGSRGNCKFGANFWGLMVWEYLVFSWGSGFYLVSID